MTNEEIIVKELIEMLHKATMNLSVDPMVTLVLLKDAVSQEIDAELDFLNGESDDDNE